jgi:excisionase family DNA binding protein
MKSSKSTKPLLTVHEAANLLGLRPATLYGWAYKRRVPVVKLSGKRGPLRAKASDLAALIDRSTEPSLPERFSA